MFFVSVGTPNSTKICNTLVALTSAILYDPKLMVFLTFPNGCVLLEFISLNSLSICSPNLIRCGFCLDKLSICGCKSPCIVIPPPFLVIITPRICGSTSSAYWYSCKQLKLPEFINLVILSVSICCSYTDCSRNRRILSIPRLGDHSSMILFASSKRRLNK